MGSYFYKGTSDETPWETSGLQLKWEKGLMQMNHVGIPDWQDTSTRLQDGGSRSLPVPMTFSILPHDHLLGS